MKHTTHEARHTCITQMTIHNVNESVIKEIVGHKSAQSFTERVYTHIYLKTKIDAVNTTHTWNICYQPATNLLPTVIQYVVVSSTQT